MGGWRNSIGRIFGNKTPFSAENRRVGTSLADLYTIFTARGTTFDNDYTEDVRHDKFIPRSARCVAKQRGINELQKGLLRDRSE